MSEASDGAGIDARIVFGVILGTGVGGGITFNNQLLSGPNAITGEWGHMPLPWPQILQDGHDERPGVACYCGLKGCIETYLSGPSLVRDHKLNTNQSLATNEIANQANSGDQKSEATLTRYEHRLARGLSNVINLLDPDIIVLGGGISNIERLYYNVPRIWEQWIFSDYSDTQLLKNEHGDSSGVRGAAWL
jgi:fructokinase